MHGLKLAAILVYHKLVNHLKPFGYAPPSPLVFGHTPHTEQSFVSVLTTLV